MTAFQTKFGLLLGFIGMCLFAGTLPPATRLAVSGFDPLFVTVARATRVMEARLTIEAVEIGADELAVLHANAGVIDEIGNAARGVDLVVRAVCGARFRLDDLDAILERPSL